MSGAPTRDDSPAAVSIPDFVDANREFSEGEGEDRIDGWGRDRVVWL